MRRSVLGLTHLKCCSALWIIQENSDDFQIFFCFSRLTFLCTEAGIFHAFIMHAVHTYVTIVKKKEDL